MTPQEAAEILKRHNEWRRWIDNNVFPDIPGPSPRLVEQAIDVLVAYVESQT